MSSEEDNKATDVILAAALARAIDFVKFAEAKNAALLAFSSAWSLAITTIINTQTVSSGLSNAMTIARGLFVLSILIAVWSFVPKLRPEDFDRRPLPKNLLFFGHVATLEVKALRDEVAARYVKNGMITADYLGDLSTQVAINSKIASKKYRLFGLASICVMLGIITLVLPSALSGLFGLVAYFSMTK